MFYQLFPVSSRKKIPYTKVYLKYCFFYEYVDHGTIISCIDLNNILLD